jgi:predicted porin
MAGHVSQGIHEGRVQSSSLQRDGRIRDGRASKQEYPVHRSLIAAAALAAFASSAVAQSNGVTIYGLLDQGLIKGNGGTATNPGGLGTSEAWTLGQASTSRLGVRGNEDLGGGLSAQFHIEHRFNADSGAVNSANSFWNGRSFVQLASKQAGSVYLGRDYTPADAVQRKSDPFSNDGVGQAGSVALWGNYQTPDAVGNGSRASNSLGYRSPNFGGFTFSGAVGLSETTGLGRVQSFSAEYAGGPIYAGVGFEQVKDGSNDGRGVTSLAFHYNFGVVKPILYYAVGKTGTNGDTEAKVWMIGATAPLGLGVLKAMYFDLDSDVDTGDRSKFGLGYNYLLSKRTNLYFDIGQAKQTDRENNRAYAMGVKHTF